MANLFINLVIIAPVVLLVLLWYYLIKRGWQSSTLLALTLVIPMVLLSAFLFANDPYMLRLCIGISILVGLGILTWPITSRETLEMLKFKEMVLPKPPLSLTVGCAFLYLIVASLISYYLVDPENFRFVIWLKIIPIFVFITLFGFQQEILNCIKSRHRS